MAAGYRLQIKNISEDQIAEPYIYQIIDEDLNILADVYIAANFDNLEINLDQSFDGSGVLIGLKEDVETEYAALFAQTETTTGATTSATTAPPQELQPDGNPFPDLDSSHPFFSEIIELYKQRIVSGFEDGTFKPDEKITRAEFVKIALGVTNCYDCQNPTDPQRLKYTPIAPFPDVRLPAWYYFCIAIAKDLAMVTGYGDGIFRPNQNISRAEGAAVLIRQSQIPLTEAPDGSFVDVKDYAWYKDYVYTAVEIGLIKQNGGFVFPDEKITRGEFAFMAKGVNDLFECREVDEDEDGMPDYWEMENNLDPLDATDAGSDRDFDGVPALEEFIAGTDPNYAELSAEEIAAREDVECPCLNNPNQSDTDGDGRIDACDIDLDNDGIDNALCLFDDEGVIDLDKVAVSDDNCIFNVNTNQVDVDENRIGNICEGQPFPTAAICPCADNPNQSDTDGDGIIDACDTDLDNDGVKNALCLFDDNGDLDEAKVAASDDNCIFDTNSEQDDRDANRIGNACEDICPCLDNPNQNDTDNDGIIDACDTDLDNDGVENALCIFDEDGILNEDKVNESEDNCIFLENETQTDSDFNDTGDLCEPFDDCPTLPEDADGVDDEDGCPELEDELEELFEDLDPITYVTKGPACNFIDYEADFVDGDIIMTAITDIETHEILLSTSNEANYSPNF